jgi:hypothetical protein
MIQAHNRLVPVAYQDFPPELLPAPAVAYFRAGGQLR